MAFLGGFPDSLHGHLVLGDVEAGLLLELVLEVLGDHHVNVLSSEGGVSVGGLDLKHALHHLEDGDVKGASSQIVDGDDLGGVLVKTVGETGGGGLIDDSQDLEAGDLSGVLGGLSLRVVEVGGHGDHGLGDGLAEVSLGRLLHLHQDEGADLTGRELVTLGGLEPGVAVGVGHDLVAQMLDVLLDVGVGELATDESLGGVEGVLRVGDGLPLGRGADESFTLLGECDHRGGRAHAFGVLNDLGSAALHQGDTGVGGSEIDSDNVLAGCLRKHPHGLSCHQFPQHAFIYIFSFKF